MAIIDQQKANNLWMTAENKNVFAIDNVINANVSNKITNNDIVCNNKNIKRK